MIATEPLFCSVEMAARIEGTEQRMIAEAATAAGRRDPGLGAFVRPLAGGAAVFAGPLSPLTKIVGLGFDGGPIEAALAEIEAALAVHRVSPRIELASLADPALAAFLTRRGYVFTGVENVLGRRLAGFEAPPPAAGVAIEASGEEGLDAWLDLAITGFAHPDAEGAGVDESFPREILDAVMRDLAAASGFTRLVARRDGAPAGAASLRIDGGVALLCGAATLPAHRRRGVQSALVGERLARARLAGCELAVVTVQPGSRSQQNAQRQGFQLLYTRAVLVREA